MPASVKPVTTQERILAFVNANRGFATYAEILAAVRVSAQQVDYAIKGLERQRLIRRVLGVYQLPEYRYIPPARSLDDGDGAPPAFRMCMGCERLKAGADFYNAEETRCKCCRRDAATRVRRERKTRLATRLALAESVVTAESAHGPASRRPASKRASNRLCV